MKRPRAVFRRVSIPFPRRQGWGRVGLIGFGAGVPVANANDAPCPPVGVFDERTPAARELRLDDIAPLEHREVAGVGQCFGDLPD
jgi:hypothetical protein